MMMMKRPIEQTGRDGAVGDCEGCVLRDVVLEVWEDGGEVGEVGGGCEEGGGGQADETGSGAEFEDVGTWGGVGWRYGWVLMMVRVFGWVLGVRGEVKTMCFGRGFDAGEETGKESGKAFGEEVGSYPSLMAEIIAC